GVGVRAVDQDLDARAVARGEVGREAARDLDPDRRAPRIQRLADVARPVGPADDAEMPARGERVHQRARRGGLVVVHHERRDVPHVSGDGVAEEHDLEDRRAEHDPLGPRVAEELAEFLLHQRADPEQPLSPRFPPQVAIRSPLLRTSDPPRPTLLVPRHDAHRVILFWNDAVASPIPAAANTSMDSPWVQSASSPTPFRNTPRVTFTK